MPQKRKKPVPLHSVMETIAHRTIINALSIKNKDYYECVHHKDTIFKDLIRPYTSPLQSSRDPLFWPFPVLQIGSQFYTGFEGIHNALETLFPFPTLYPTPISPRKRACMSMSTSIFNWVSNVIQSTVIHDSYPTSTGYIPHLNRLFQFQSKVFLFDTSYPHLCDLIISAARWYISSLDQSRMTSLGKTLFPVMGNLARLSIESDGKLSQKEVTWLLDFETCKKIAEIYSQGDVKDTKEVAVVTSAPSNLLAYVQYSGVNACSEELIVKGTLLKVSRNCISVRLRTEKGGGLELHLPKRHLVIKDSILERNNHHCRVSSGKGRFKLVE